MIPLISVGFTTLAYMAGMLDTIHPILGWVCIFVACYGNMALVSYWYRAAQCEGYLRRDGIELGDLATRGDIHTPLYVAGLGPVTTVYTARMDGQDALILEVGPDA